MRWVRRAFSCRRVTRKVIKISSRLGLVSRSGSLGCGLVKVRWALMDVWAVMVGWGGGGGVCVWGCW